MPSNSTKSTVQEPFSNVPIRIGMLSLGCPKTLVDSETILGKFSQQQFHIVPSVTDCDVALLNTCAFIQEAQEESIDKIMELIELKKEGRIKAVVVMGCLVQRYPKELQKELKEVDAFIGSGEYDKVPAIAEKAFQGLRQHVVKNAGYLATSGESRVSLTPDHYRYLKISEGCDHICAFCTIPSFRGKHRSRSIEDVVAEANNLVAAGAQEIILTGQDTTYFGKDITGNYDLPKLIHALNKIDALKWLRLLYAYPSCVTTDLMEAMRDSEKMCKYLDMPLQHHSDAMLTAMKRGITKRRTYDLIQKFRSIIPNLAIRTTFIVGFPGETDQDFAELLDFMKEIKFERLGIFMYSQEQGTDASKLEGQVPEEVKSERFDQAMMLQQEISRENNKRFLNSELDVIVDERVDNQDDLWVGRSYMDAPEVDGSVLIQTNKNLLKGSIQKVLITSTQEYDLVGQLSS